MIIGKVVAKGRRAVARWSLAGGSGRRAFYYKFISDAFSREESAVGVGIQRYQAELGAGRQIYLLRRNIHMLEKGLTMRPRRQEFALDYIGRTVAAFGDLVDRDANRILNVDEFRWMLSVLADYFEATSRSENEKIVRLRGRFGEIRSKLAVSVELSSGPHNPQPINSPVDVVDLESLARGRRSVRWFTDKPVPRELVDTAVRIAAEAPTACNRQPYRFEIFDDPESVAKVSAVPMGTAGYGHQLAGMIVIVGDLSAFFDERDRHLIYIDGCLAAMSLILGLESQNVASCCINWPDIAEREKAMKDLLGLGDHERVVMLVAYGYADPTGLVPFSAKKELDTVRTFRKL